MNYSILLSDIQDTYKETSIMIDKIDIYIESMYREYTINKEESELKVLTESGTNEDLEFLYEKAEESLGQRIEQTMQKICKTVENFINKIIKKVKDKYYDTKFEMFIRELQKKIKRHEEVGSRNVKIFDVTKIERAFNESVDKCHKLATNIKNNVSDAAEDIADNIRDKIDEIHKDFIDKRSKSEKEKKDVSLKRAIGYLQSLKNSITKDKFNKNIFIDIPEKASALKKRILLQINQKISLFYKETCATKFAAITDCFNRIKSAVSTKAAEIKEKLPIGESVAEDDNANNSIFEECFDDLFESVYDDVYNEHVENIGNNSNSFMDELYALL